MLPDNDASPIDHFERPNPLWYAAFHSGLAALAVMSVSQDAYEAIAGRVPMPSRRTIQVMWVGASLIHAVEAPVAYRRAKAAGMHSSARRWAVETFIIGFPALLKQRSLIRRPADGYRGTGFRAAG